VKVQRAPEWVVSADNGWLLNALLYISSCQSAAIFDIVKRFWSWVPLTQAELWQVPVQSYLPWSPWWSPAGCFANPETSIL